MEIHLKVLNWIQILRIEKDSSGTWDISAK